MAEGTREIVINLDGLTGGGGGITVPTVGAAAATKYLGNDGFYLVYLVLAVLALLVTCLLYTSRCV